MEVTTDSQDQDAKPKGEALKARVLRRTRNIVVVVLALYGAVHLVWLLIGFVGIVRPALASGTFLSPNRHHRIAFKGSDVEGDQTLVESVDFEKPGFHPFSSLPLFVKSGAIYGARWTSSDTVTLFVSSEFAFTSSKERQFSMDDTNGKYLVTLQTIR